jgi:hypothetical protein
MRPEFWLAVGELSINYFAATRLVFIAALTCGGDTLFPTAGKVCKSALSFYQ